MAINTNLKDLRPSREKFQRVITLLSGGYANKAAFPGGQITVYPWDNTVDEWLANQVRKGTVKGRNLLFSVLPRVCSMNNCRVDQFIASEVLTVLMVARAILRNDVIMYQATCSACGAVSSNSVKIPDNLEKIGEKKEGWPGYDLIKLPVCGDVVKVRMVTVGEELAVTERTDAERNRTCSDNFARVIAGLIDVNGGAPDNAREAITWILALAPEDQEYLLEQFDKTQPQLGTAMHHVCDECGAEFDYTLQLNEDFFRRKGVPGDSREVADPVRPSVQVEGSSPRHNSSAGVAHTKPAAVARGAGA